MISVSVVNWYMGEDGWSFDEGEGVVPDPVFGANHLRDVYAAALEDYTGRVTVPVLLDKQTKQIVSNESSEIIRMFSSSFDELGAKPGDYYPEELRKEVDAVNERVYDTFNNGVYKSGFATTQAAYEKGGVSAVRHDGLDGRAAVAAALAGGGASLPKLISARSRR
jgi:putative glutathione S-transferase